MRVTDYNSIYQLVVPTNYQKRALTGCHDDVGHVGRDHTLSLLRQCFSWPEMAKMVTDYEDLCTQPDRQHAQICQPELGWQRTSGMFIEA